MERRDAEAGRGSRLLCWEAMVARLAGDRLFISTRTVKYEVRKVFAKLAISSRASRR